MQKLNPSRIVVRDHTQPSVREVFYHPTTGIQVAVTDWNPTRLVKRYITIHIPYDGRKGYRVVANGWASAGRIISAQNTWIGRLLCKLILAIQGRRLKPISMTYQGNKREHF